MYIYSVFKITGYTIGTGYQLFESSTDFNCVSQTIKITDNSQAYAVYRYTYWLLRSLPRKMNRNKNRCEIRRYYTIIFLFVSGQLEHAVR